VLIPPNFAQHHEEYRNVKAGHKFLCQQ